MVIRRRAFALFSAALLLIVSTASNLVAQGRPLSKDEEREAKAVTAALANAASGKPVTNDLALAWVRNDGLQAQEDKSVVAFALTLDPAKAPAGKVFMLWRVMPAGADPKDKKIVPLFENFSTARSKVRRRSLRVCSWPRPARSTCSWPCTNWSRARAAKRPSR